MLFIPEVEINSESRKRGSEDLKLEGRNWPGASALVEEKKDKVRALWHRRVRKQTVDDQQTCRISALD